MALTSDQKATLKAAILAETDVAFVAYRDAGQTVRMAEWLNQTSTPAFYVWRSTLSAAQARAAISGGDGLAQLDNLTAGKRDSLLWVFEGDTFPSNAEQRSAIENLCGTQNTLKAAIVSAQKRTVSKAERLFATGTGSEASPGALSWEGSISGDDVASAMNG